MLKEFMDTMKVLCVEVVCYPDGRMDTPNASKYSGLQEKTMAMQRSNGTGPKFVKMGRIFYFKEDLDEWMAAHGRHTSTAQARHAKLASVT
jgi:hypothetical protein